MNEAPEQCHECGCIGQHYKGCSSSSFQISENNHCKLIGEATTVGELKKFLSGYDDNASFGFRSQPMQALYEVRYGKEKYVVFQ